MNLPASYQWLRGLDGLPNTIRLALDEYGVAEIIGTFSSRTIMSWRDELNLAGVKISGYSDDDIPWCGPFVAIVCLRRMGRPEEVVKDPLWARNWASYGRKFPMPALGGMLVFARGSGGHVGFYVGEDRSCYHVLGGNQSNKVCITRIQKSRLLAARRPPYQTTPEAVRVYHLAPEGGVSQNES